MKRRVLGLLASASMCVPLTAYLDNRYFFPVNRHLFQCIPPKRSVGQLGAFFMTANSARNCAGDTVYLPALEGCYDLVQVNKAMNSVGLTNPYYLSNWVKAEIPFNSFGKLRATGIDWSLEVALGKHWSLGAAFTFMHCSSRYNYCLSQQTQKNLAITHGDECYPGRGRSFEQARLCANQILGLQSGQWSASGLGDTDLFVRFDARTDYLYKLKQIDGNLIFGCMAPTGRKRDLYAPTSVPFGGNGQWGLFGQGTLCFEITDDWFFGVDVFASKRLAKTQLQRMPAGNEPLPYGVIIDYARVSPGFLVGWSPYLVADDLYDGFGLYVTYTYAHHFCDCWNYNGQYRPNLARLSCAGHWTNEFFTLGLDYDFTKRLTPHEYGPRIYFDWTLPTNICGAACVAKTNRVSLGIEFHF